MSFATALLTLAAAFPAANAYKCKQADGSIAFQQTPCAATAETLGQHRYERQPDVPHTQYVPSRDSRAAQERAAAEEARVQAQWVAASRGLLAPLPSLDAPQADAYSCFDGAKTWVQQTPCPKTVVRGHAVPVSVSVGPRGETSQGTAMVPRETAVQQRPISRDEVCRQVQAGTATAQKEQRASDASYERNKLRNNNGC